jgi:hypothetical protein
MKVLFGMALRQTTGFVESLLRLIDLDWAVPDFSTLCRPLPDSACLHAREGTKGSARQYPVSRFTRPAAPPDPLSGIGQHRHQG